MANKDLLNIIAVAVICITIYVICMAAALADTFNQVKIECERAQNERERRYWKKKYWITCLKCVPFMHIIIKMTGIDKDHE